MCGIVGAVAHRNVVPMLMDGLRRLEYRGYDSSGVAAVGDDGALHRVRAVGKVRELEVQLEACPLAGEIGIAHTRWATHGGVTEANAHPHISNGSLALVHNGIIENHQPLRGRLAAAGARFDSETDTEVIVHLIQSWIERECDLLEAVRRAVDELEGAYALAVVSTREPHRLVVARRGGPLVVGFGEGENFVASDISALVAVTRRFAVLEQGDVAEVTREAVHILDRNGNDVHREEHVSQLTADAVELGNYRHFMQKEIFEQPRAVAETLEGRLSADSLLEDEAFGAAASEVFDHVRAVQIIACGTSYHAGLVARYWLEELGVACDVEIASEFRYRRHVVAPDTLVVAISQSGETVDTLAALDEARSQGFGPALAICNRAESSLVRACELLLMTHAGPEIGVASTKAFSTQLVALLLLGIALGRRRGLTPEREARIVTELRSLPTRIEQALALDEAIQDLAVRFADKHHALFLGRGAHYPIAMEGALKLKEISYIHAEAYAAGELKHGPLALADADMPVVAVAPNDTLLEKLKSNIQEVHARGGRLLVFADGAAGFETGDGIEVVPVNSVDAFTSPIVYTVPLQLLAYHVALIKGTDVDKPRNLAKSVTVE